MGSEMCIRDSLKDGASSLYGSDAVAGVVNHITRDDLVGAEVVFDYRNGQGSQETFQGDAIFGGEFGPKIQMSF